MDRDRERERERNVYRERLRDMRKIKIFIFPQQGLSFDRTCRKQWKGYSTILQCRSAVAKVGRVGGIWLCEG